MKRISAYFGSGQRSSATSFSSASPSSRTLLERGELVVARVDGQIEALDVVGVDVRGLERADRLDELGRQGARLGGEGVHPRRLLERHVA